VESFRLFVQRKGLPWGNNDPNGTIYEDKLSRLLPVAIMMYPLFSEQTMRTYFLANAGRRTELAVCKWLVTRKRFIAVATCFASMVSSVIAQSQSDLQSDSREVSANEIYRSRIRPLLESPDKSSCSECHLRGVELRDFLSADQAETFSELRARGWIDLENPDKSKLLEFISRSPEKPNELIDRVRKAEFAALKTWITAATKDPDLLKQPLQQDDDLQLPVEFIRHARNDHVLARFCEAIWSQLGRCASCHSPDRNQRQVEKHGEQMTWIVPRDPAATLALLVERQLIDLENPEQSELRTKPLILVEHGGGPKFSIGGHTDEQWQSFLKDYARIVRGEYSATSPLPTAIERRSWLSEMQLKITDLPKAWRGRLLTVSLHPKSSNGDWSDTPIAIADSPVNRRQLVWQHNFTVFQSTDKMDEVTDWSKPLVPEEVIPVGKYQLRLRLGRLVVSEEFKPVLPNGEHDPKELVATGEIKAPWPLGYQPPKIVSFSTLRTESDTARR
jgi:hypothetical protein